MVRQKEYLKVTQFETPLNLARRLPPDLAWKCRAVPIGEKDNQITVAMATPDDVEAQEMVMNILGPSTCVVQADAHTIEDALIHLWPELAQRRLRVLYWACTQEKTNQIESYAQAVAGHLKARAAAFQTGLHGQRTLQALAVEADGGGYDLVIFNLQVHSLLQTLLAGNLETKLMDQTSASILIAHEPRWPLKKILLIIRDGGNEDQAAIEWAIQMAQSSDINVTILPLIPPMPAMYAGEAALHHSLPSLLNADTSLGRELRHVARRLVNQEIKGTIRLRNEPPCWQVLNEINEGNYDLVIIAAKPHKRLLRWFRGEMINPLVWWTDRPTLIAKPIIFQKEKEKP